ncbi:MAG TPA: ArdC-like ssDNA-binding domain-containing protein [Bryobacteraceae bacterium]|nr:ArdC-like ssDNA-binding domain-containing protein [Bryobacteraceae bacterium]
MNTEKQDVYARITGKIIADLEQGVRPWLKPWNAAHTQGRITRPLRHNGVPYSGINILMLWASAMEQGFAAPMWMTFKQALELDAHVRKGEKGSLVVYANSITRTETSDAGRPARNCGKQDASLVPTAALCTDGAFDASIFLWGASTRMASSPKLLKIWRRLNESSLKIQRRRSRGPARSPSAIITSSSISGKCA